MTHQERQQFGTTKQNEAALAFALTQTAAKPEAQSTDACLCTDLAPCADLEPTTKSVPRKSDEPIERGSKNDPQTTTQDASKP